MFVEVFDDFQMIFQSFCHYYCALNASRMVLPKASLRPKIWKKIQKIQNTYKSILLMFLDVFLMISCALSQYEASPEAFKTREIIINHHKKNTKKNI